jgi:hypothetical protein
MYSYMYVFTYIWYHIHIYIKNIYIGLLTGDLDGLSADGHLLVSVWDEDRYVDSLTYAFGWSTFLCKIV